MIAEALLRVYGGFIYPRTENHMKRKGGIHGNWDYIGLTRGIGGEVFLFSMRIHRLHIDKCSPLVFIRSDQK